MNTKYILILWFSLFVLSCGEEYENIETETTADPTVELNTGSVAGIVVDQDDEKVLGSTVQIIVNGTVLHEEEATDGTFEFENVSLNKERTLVKAFTNEHSPNYQAFSAIIDGRVELNKIRISKFGKKVRHDVNSDITIQSSNTDIIIPENTISNNTMNVDLAVRLYDFSVDVHDLYGISSMLRSGIEEDISFSHGIFIQAIHDNGNVAQIKPNKSYTIKLAIPEVVPLADQVDIWYFDEKSGLWQSDYTADYVGGKYVFETNVFGHFAIEGEVIRQMSSFDDLENDSLSIQPWTCTAVYLFPEVNDISDVVWSVAGATQLYSTGESVELSLGTTEIRVKGTNSNGIEEEHSFLIKVIDDVPPVPVCQDNIQVGFEQVSDVTLYSKDLDNGSHDAGCGDVTFQIALMSENPQFRDQLTFGPDDLAGEQFVILRVFDTSGNFNDCLVRVTSAQSGNGPLAICNERVVISLDQNGEAKVFADVFDEGSYAPDGGAVTLQVKRTESTCDQSEEFSDSVTFCKDDLGRDDVAVKLLVTDSNGLSNVCFTLVTVEDKTSNPGLIVVCQDLIKVELGEGDKAVMGPELFIEGGLNPEYTYSIQKIGGTCSEDTSDFMEHITLCPSDIGEDISYVVQVEYNGDTNRCWGTVQVNASGPGFDTKAPTPYCVQGLSTAVMNQDGTVEIWAKDFDLGSFDDVTAKQDLVFSFEENTLVEKRQFTCNDIAFGNTFELKMWVWDEAGNKDYCQVTLMIEKNGFCGDGPILPPVAVCSEQVVISLTEDGTATIFAETFDDGSFSPNGGILKYEVKKLHPGSCDNDNEAYSPQVYFCKADIDSGEVLVLFRVTDPQGESNECMVSVTVQDKIGGCDEGVNVGLAIGEYSGKRGAEICIPVTVKNFYEVSSIQVGFSWDPTVIELKNIEETGIENGVNNSNEISNGKFRYLWLDNTATNPATLRDGDSIFELCFEVVGNTNDVSPLQITSFPEFFVEIVREWEDVEICINNGSFTVE